METKTLVKIVNDYNSDGAYQYWKEYLNELCNDNDFFVEIHNNRNYINPVNNLCNKGVNSIEVDAIGYSQSDWQKYTIYYNDDKNNVLEIIVSLLEKTFTHKNDYLAYKYEYTEVNGKIFVSPDFYDCEGFFITNTEFPNVNDVLNDYNALHYGDYDKIEICID